MMKGNEANPSSFRFVGQPNVQEQLYIVTQHSITHGLPLPHVLLTGAAGLGKTTLSREVSRVMCVPFREQPAQTFTTKMIQNDIPRMAPRAILFIDEIHRLKITAEELLYSIMQDQKLGDLNVPHITIIGATTIEGLLSKPFRDRFMLVLKFRDYNLGELVAILNMNGCSDNFVASEIATRSRGVPRIAKNLFEFCKQYADSNRLNLDYTVVDKVAKLKKIDRYGLEENDRRMLALLAEKRKAVGLDSLSHTLDIDVNTIKDVLEHYLLKVGFIEITSEGRSITEKGLVYVSSCEGAE